MLYLLMFLQIGAMFYALRLHRRRQLFANVIPAGIAVQIFGIGSAFVAILKIVFLIFVGGTVDESRKEVANAEYAALWYFGSYIAKQYDGKKLTLLVAPEEHADRNQKNRIKGFMEGMEKKLLTEIVEVDFVNTKGKRRRRSYTYQNLDKALRKNKEQDVVISLIGLPMGYYEMPFWQSSKLPKFYTYRGYSWEIDIDIKENRITGFITFNPKNKFKGKDGKKAEKTETFFNDHFIFVTSANLNKMVRSFPSLFYRPGDKK